jgi:hypothetical protein
MLYDIICPSRKINGPKFFTYFSFFFDSNVREEKLSIVRSERNNF